MYFSDIKGTLSSNCTVHNILAINKAEKYVDHNRDAAIELLGESLDLILTKSVGTELLRTAQIRIRRHTA